MKGISTQQVADRIQISKSQLLRWLRDKKIPEVHREKVAGLEVRVWTQVDVYRAEKFREKSIRTRTRRK